MENNYPYQENFRVVRFDPELEKIFDMFKEMLKPLHESLKTLLPDPTKDQMPFLSTQINFIREEIEKERNERLRMELWPAWAECDRLEHANHLCLAIGYEALIEYKTKMEDEKSLGGLSAAGRKILRDEKFMEICNIAMDMNLTHPKFANLRELLFCEKDNKAIPDEISMFFWPKIVFTQSRAAAIAQASIFSGFYGLKTDSLVKKSKRKLKEIAEKFRNGELHVLFVPSHQLLDERIKVRTVIHYAMPAGKKEALARNAFASLDPEYNYVEYIHMDGNVYRPEFLSRSWLPIYGKVPKEKKKKEPKKKPKPVRKKKTAEKIPGQFELDFS